MPAKLLALGALAAVLAVNGLDMALLDFPAVRNGPVMYAALIVPIALAVAAVTLARTILTFVMLGLVLVLGGGYVAGRTVLLKLPPAAATLKPGDPAPDFKLGGDDATLDSLRGKGQLVIVFFRGAW